MAFDVKIEGTKELSKVLVDVLSPASEVLGSLGDKVRVYRQVSLLRSLNKAKAIAENEGLKLVEPSLKFLVPYLEDCSLEDPEDEALIEMWARLLVDASTTPKSEHNLFIRVLRELTGNEARLFHYLASPETHRHCRASRHPVDVESDWKPTFVSIAIRDAIESLGGLEEIQENDSFSELYDTFLAREETAGSVVYFFDISEGVPGHYPKEDTAFTSPRGPIDDDFGQNSIAILKALNLIGDFQSPEIWFGKYCFLVYAYYLTGLGASFAEACTDILQKRSGT
jgi:hypothetical protein